MRRDMDLIRNILLELESQPSAGPLKDLRIESYNEDEISYHVLLLHEAGLIEALDASGRDRLQWWPIRLTWQGHEFLEASRDDARWKAAKEKIVGAGGGLVFEVLKQLLVTLMKNAVFGA